MDSGPPPYSPSSYPSNHSSEQTHLRPGGHNQSGYGAINDNRGANRKRGVNHWLTLFIILAFSVAISSFVTSQLMRGYWHREIDSLNYEKRKIVGRENMVTGREKKIAGREEEVQHETERLGFLDRQLKFREARIANEKREITGREEKVQHETERLSVLDRQLKYKEARIIDEQEKIDDQKEDLRHEKERLGLDAERIARSNVHWGPLKWDEACVGWKKMRYSAELEMLPQDVDGIAWCHAMSIDIFGTTFKEPDYCEKTLDGRIIGHWTRTDEPHCNTYWGNKQDWGCQPGVPGYRRIRMQLLDHHEPWEETWFALCETTPWPGHGTPENCENTAGGGGIWGEWRVRDNECQEQ